MAPNCKGSKKFQKKTIENYKGRFLNIQKVSFMLLYCYYNSHVICRTLGGVPISF
jgi:hypothetical protein